MTDFRSGGRRLVFPESFDVGEYRRLVHRGCQPRKPLELRLCSIKWGIRTSGLVIRYVTSTSRVINIAFILIKQKFQSHGAPTIKNVANSSYYINSDMFLPFFDKKGSRKNLLLMRCERFSHRLICSQVWLNSHRFQTFSWKSVWADFDIIGHQKLPGRQLKLHASFGLHVKAYFSSDYREIRQLSIRRFKIKIF